MAARPGHGADVFVGDRNELTDDRWVTLAEAEQLMRPHGMSGPVREHSARSLRPCDGIVRATSLARQHGTADQPTGGIHILSLP
jgi:hypothetical protein